MFDRVVVLLGKERRLDLVLVVLPLRRIAVVLPTTDHRLDPAAIQLAQRGLHFAGVHREGVIVVVEMVVMVIVGVVRRRRLVHGCGGKAGRGGGCGRRREGFPQDGDGMGMGEEDVGAAAQRFGIGLAGQEGGAAGGKR